MSKSHAIKNDNTLIKTPTDDYNKLRSLILGENYESVIEKQLDQDEVQRVADVISEAFHERSRKDETLAQEFSPIIESAIDVSVKRNRESFADMVYPIIGPAVRKAVTNALTDMVRSLNHLLKQSLSARAIVWRYKAWRLGMDYSQFVILQNLQYRVEQVFLIHRESGLLIESCTAKDTPTKDPALISAMLTAITDFVTDSFEQEKTSDSLSSIQYGEWNLLIETGPHAVVALAVRGSVHQEIKERLQEITEAIHMQFNTQLKFYSGDSSIMEECRPILEDALIEKQKPVQHSYPWLAITLLSILAVLGIVYSIQSAMVQSSVSQLVKELNQEPGYEVISHELQQNILNVRLLRSPTSRPISDFNKQHQPLDFKLNIRETNASIYDPKFFLPVLEQKYPIQLISMSTEQGDKLIAKGQLTSEELEALKNDSMIKSIFSELDTSGITPKQSISQFTIDENEFNKLLTQLNQESIYFEVGSDVIDGRSTETIIDIVSQFKRLQELAPLVNKSIHQISVIGLADKQGNNELNQSLSEKRALLVAQLLKTNGINENIIVTWGLGNKDLPNTPLTLQRRVNFRILYQDNME